MKKAYETPVMNISVFSAEDIITASGDTASSKARKAIVSGGVSESNILEVNLND